MTEHIEWFLWVFVFIHSVYLCILSVIRIHTKFKHHFRVKCEITGQFYSFSADPLTFLANYLLKHKSQCEREESTEMEAQS